MQYTNSEINERIRERIHNKLYRRVLRLKLIDGLTCEKIAVYNYEHKRQIEKANKIKNMISDYMES